MEKLKEVREKQKEEFTTFEDIFALALANTKNSRFKADSNSWHRVIFEIWENYREKMPQFRVIFFNERPPLSPRSNEFYQLITTLSMSGLISLPNPDYEFIVMDEKQKKRAKELEEKRLGEYKEYIRKITELIDEELAVKG